MIVFRLPGTIQKRRTADSSLAGRFAFIQLLIRLRDHLSQIIRAMRIAIDKPERELRA